MTEHLPRPFPMPQQIFGRCCLLMAFRQGRSIQAQVAERDASAPVNVFPDDGSHPADASPRHRLSPSADVFAQLIMEAKRVHHEAP